MILGADGVQMGSRFVASNECSAHINFKNKIIEADEGETDLTLKELTAVRLMKNEFYDKIQQAYKRKATNDELKGLLGRGRAKKGMFEGDLIEGELEIGQASAMITEIMPATNIMFQIIEEFKETSKRFSSFEI
jgi:enoyl-[acyl-carrier protein] reductase II